MLFKTPTLLKQDGFQVLNDFLSKTELLKLQKNALKFEGSPAVLRKNVFQTCTSTQDIFKEIETHFNTERLPCSMTNYCFYLSKSEQEN